MAGFEDAWAAVAGPYFGERVSLELRPLLQEVYSGVISRPASLPGLEQSLLALLHYINTVGRTNANCWAVDSFFGLSEG